MTALLHLIYCWLLGLLASFHDLVLGAWDSLLQPADTLLSSLSTAGLSAPLIPNEYAWLLGVTGLSQALTIVAGAMATRFLLQSVPFVRWGS